MKMVVFSIAMTLMGVMLIGLIHNPNTMSLGMVMLVISQSMMFASGYRKGRPKKLVTA